MKFLVRSSDGSQREVELAGTVAVVGRDPSCDLVIKDPKCSRRHAILEAGPDGISVRDNESVNGVFVNGRQVERANLKDGDVIRLGEAEITVLPEDIPPTLAMGPADAAAIAAAFPSHKPPTHAPQPPPPAAPPPAPAAPPPTPVAPPPTPVAPPAAPVAPRPAAPSRAPAPEPAPPAAPPPPSAPRPPEVPPRKAPEAAPAPPAIVARAPESGPIPRPLTVTMLAVLWAASIPLYLAGGAFGFVRLSGTAATGAVVGGLLMAVLAALMVSGLWSMRLWARVVQITIAAVGLLICPFAIAAAATLAYMLRADTKIRFSGRRDYGLLKPAEAETVRIGSPEGLFTVIVVANVALVAVAAGIRVGQAIPPMLKARAAANEAAVLAQVRGVVAAQEAFKAACGSGFADAEGLTNPASTLTGDAAGKPPFLSSGSLNRDRLDYHFELEASDPAPETPACRRSFKRYEYLAVPLKGSGRSFLAADGAVHAAQGRPATKADPVVR